MTLTHFRTIVQGWNGPDSEITTQQFSDKGEAIAYAEKYAGVKRIEGFDINTDHMIRDYITVWSRQ